MLISCPNCKTTFAIPAKAIGATGRKLKCSKCANVWMQEPIKIDKEQFNNLLKVEYKDTNNLPTRYKRAKLNIFLIIGVIFLLIGAFVIEVLEHPNKYPTIAEKLNTPDYSGIRFHDFHVESQIVDNKLDYYIKGTIVNTTSEKLRIPVINVKIYSKGGRVMIKNKIAIPKEFIGPFERLEVKPEITGISGNAEQIELSFENWLESSLR